MSSARSDSGARAFVVAAVAIDRAGLRPLPAAKATAGVVVPLIAGVVAGDPVAGATAAFGALSVGIPLLTAGPRTPTATMLAASAGMAVATFAGSVSGLVPPVHLLVLAAAGFLAGLLVAAGRGATQVGVNATIALLIFGRVAAGPGPAALHAAWVLAGGLFQTGLAVLFRSPRPLRAQRHALAAAFDALALSTDAAPSIAVAEAAVTARDAVEHWARAYDTRESAQLRGLADQLDRLRYELHALHFQRTMLMPDAPPCQAVGEVLDLAGGALAQVAEALRRGRAPAGVDTAAGGIAALADRLARPAAQDGTTRASAAPVARFLAARSAALAGQLRAVHRMAAELAGARRLALPVTAADASAIVVLPGGLVSVARQLRAAASPASPAFRHAVRLAVVVPLATLLAAHVPWQHGYWLAVTALIVLRPDFAATVGRGAARIVGTGAGVVLAAAIVAAAHPRGGPLIAVVIACTWLGYTVFAANYALYALFLTTLVIVLVTPAGQGAAGAVRDRALDTLIGGGIAILAYLAWPTWEAGTLRSATGARFEALRRYLGTVLRSYAQPQEYDPAALARLAAATRRAQSSVTASLERARGDPARARPDLGRYAGLLAAGRRIAGGAHALASHLRDASRPVAVPAAAEIARQVDLAMAALVDAIEAGGSAGELPDLRRSQRELAAATAVGQTLADRRGAILAALLDQIVDAINTAADLLGRLPEPGGGRAADDERAADDGRAADGEHGRPG